MNDLYEELVVLPPDADADGRGSADQCGNDAPAPDIRDEPRNKRTPAHVQLSRAPSLAPSSVIFLCVFSGCK